MEDKIIDLLTKKGPLVAAEIMQATGCSKGAIYRLKKSGKIHMDILVYGSGGFDGLGFRTRPFGYVYFIPGSI